MRLSRWRIQPRLTLRLRNRQPFAPGEFGTEHDLESERFSEQIKLKQR
jgi:hypothetical protein